MTKRIDQLSTLAINRHLSSCSAYCYINLPDGRRLRVSRVRYFRKQMQGRIILGSPKVWETIPGDATVELS